MAYVVEHSESGRRDAEIEAFAHHLSTLGADMCRMRRVGAVFDDQWMRDDVLTDVRRESAGRGDDPRRVVRIYLQLLVLRRRNNVTRRSSNVCTVLRYFLKCTP